MLTLLSNAPAGVVAAFATGLLDGWDNVPWQQLIVNGLGLGALYALTAFGIVLIYKTTDVITFAQGEMAMFSTFVAYTLLAKLRLPYGATFALTLLFAGLLGVIVERVAMRPLTGSLLNPVIVTIGLGLILTGMAGRIWGYDLKTFPSAVEGSPLRGGGVFLKRDDALILVVTAILMLVIFVFFRYTLTGTAMRAVAQNKLAARLMGINVNRINALGWGLGTALGAVTGLLIAPRNSLDPGMMGDVAVKAFAAAVLGGLSSLPGAVVGGLILGVIDSIAGFREPGLKTTIAFVLIVLVLAIRPAGLLGKKVIKKV